jgi:outer membrane lipoprotein LolB
MVADCRTESALKSLILKTILLLVCVAGCVSKPAPVGAPVDFAISGKFGVSDGSEGYSARFNWQQRRDDYDIEVWGPLGQGRTFLRGDGRSMQVQRGTDILAQGVPERVMYENLGWSLPLHVLPAWMRGEPQGELDVGDVLYDSEGRYAQFAQMGWLVSLSKYKARTGVATPARIVATNGSRKVTVVVHEFLQ